MEQSDWSVLLPELIDALSKTLTDMDDIANVGRVSRGWESATEIHRRGVFEAPLILIPMKKNSIQGEFFNLALNKVYFSKVPELQGKLFCYSSSGGWLVTVSEYNDLDLINPLNHDKYELPVSKALRNSIPKKFVLSSAASSSCVIMSLYVCGTLEFCKLREDKTWTSVLSVGTVGRSADLTCCRGKFYVLGAKNIFVCDLEVPIAKIVGQEIPEELRCPLGKRYLVESSGTLLMVLSVKQPGTSDSLFRIFQISLADHKCWRDCELHTLGSRAIFLGEDHSFSVDATNNLGVKANCIYFLYDPPYEQERVEMGIFDLEQRKIERPYNLQSSGSDAYQSHVPHHLWLQKGLSVKLPKPPSPA